MKKILLSILGVSLLLFSACSQETELGGNPSKGEMNLTVEVENYPDKAGKTRAEENAISVNGENMIGSLYLMFFEPSTDGSGEYIAYTTVPMPDPTPGSSDGGMGMSVDTDFEFPTGTTEGDEYKILAIANISDNYYIDGTVFAWMAQWAGMTEKEVTARAKGQLPTALSSNRIIMHGSMDLPEGGTQAHLLLSRDLSRLDVTNMTGATHELVSVSVWNAYPETALWDEKGMLDYTANVERIRRHYVVNSIDGANIRGGLYAFSNQVQDPEDNDKVTTCLIVGLKPVSPADAPTVYFRANLLDTDTGMQVLRRNHAYNLQIMGVTGPGAPTEEIAYLGESNKLVYEVNEDWFEDNNGLSVTDGQSTLMIPTKTINMGKLADVAEHKILTFSSLPSPAPLSIRSTTFSPAAVDGEPTFDVRLDGNTLIVESSDLDLDETRRAGVVVLSYAGLELAINISQSGTHDDFLIVTEPDGGLLPFAAYGGITSGLINVQASGHWTATLHMEGFSFSPQMSLDPVKMIWTNPDMDGTAFEDGRGANTTLGFITPDENNSTIKKFRVTTHSANMGNSSRRAYIEITLDGKEEEYSSVVLLTQQFVKSLNYVPVGEDPLDTANWQTAGGVITFDGTGSTSAGSVDQWYVVSATEEGSSRFLPWSPVLVASGTDDRARFEIVRTSSADTNYDPTNPLQNYVKVKAVGMNTSGRDYTATLRVQLTADPGTFSDITLIQKSASFELSPGIISAQVSPYGGETQHIGIDVGETENMFWRVTNIEQTQVQTQSGRRLANHGPATVAVYNAAGEFVEDIEMNKPYPQDYEFAVKFPQIYYPNRGISVGANVTVAVAGQGQTTGGMVKTIAATQTALTSRGIKSASRGFTGYGSLFPVGSYIEWYRPAITGINGYTMVRGGTGPDAVQTPLLKSDGFNYIHLTSYAAYDDNGPDNSVWQTAKDGMILMKDEMNGGITFMIMDDTASGNRANPILFGGAPYNEYSVYNGSGGGGIGVLSPAPGSEDNKIWKFFVTEPHYGSAVTDVRFVGDGVSTAMSSLPESAVTLLRHQDTNRSVLTVDPVNSIIFLGDSQFLEIPDVTSTDYATYRSGNRTLAETLLVFVAKAAQYGSSFTDMFIEDGTDGAVAAPWDEVWGDNRLDKRDTDHTIGRAADDN